MSYPFSDPSPNADLPPLRIHHFMLWTAVLAVMLTGIKGCSPHTVGSVQVSETSHESSHVSIPDEQLTSGIPALLIYSICLTGLLLCWNWKRHGLTVFDEPGQMSFILNGLVAGCIILGVVAINLVAGGTAIAQGQAWLFLVLPWGFLCLGAAYLVLTFRYSRHFAAYGGWGRFYTAHGILTVLGSLTSLVVPFFFFANPFGTEPSILSFSLMHFGVPFLLGAIELFFWIRAVRHDLTNAVPYHWTHWVGAFTWPAFLLTSAIQHLIFALNGHAAD